MAPQPNLDLRRPIVKVYRSHTHTHTHAVQQDTQSFLWLSFIHHMLARHVSDLTGPSSGAFIYKLYVQIWYVL